MEFLNSNVDRLSEMFLERLLIRMARRYIERNTESFCNGYMFLNKRYLETLLIELYVFFVV